MKEPQTALSEISHEVIECRQCERLVVWREKVGIEKRRAFRDHDYWAKPVPGFGDANGRVMVLGLAPGAHGSNRTGRMFTGDDSGRFLYAALHRAGYANQATADSQNDGLKISDLWITAVCRCAPPDNKPSPVEITNCRSFLTRELDVLACLKGIVALGRIAYDAAFQIAGRIGEKPIFGHGVLCEAQDDKPWILASYHPSRQNTQTGRLTEPMFDDIWIKVKTLLTVN
jgi:uracil-DNA glycosylase